MRKITNIGYDVALRTSGPLGGNLWENEVGAIEKAWELLSEMDRKNKVDYIYVIKYTEGEDENGWFVEEEVVLDFTILIDKMEFIKKDPRFNNEVFNKISLQADEEDPENDDIYTHHTWEYDIEDTEFKLVSHALTSWEYNGEKYILKK